MGRPASWLCIVLIAFCSDACASRSMQAVQQNRGSGVAPLLQDVYSFWLKHGPDKQYGECFLV
jgi:hypothetical protein